jgi:hypothetical protein
MRDKGKIALKGRYWPASQRSAIGRKKEVGIRNALRAAKSKGQRDASQRLFIIDGRCRPKYPFKFLMLHFKLP